MFSNKFLAKFHYSDNPTNLDVPITADDWKLSVHPVTEVRIPYQIYRLQHRGICTDITMLTGYRGPTIDK